MRIIKLESFTKPYISVVRLTMEDGSIGWGQMSTYHADITAQIFHRQLVPHVLGARLESITEDLDDLGRLVLEKEHKFPGSYLLRALAGLDTAVWDWYGRQQEKPVTSLIGGSPGQLRAYASSMKRDITADEELARFQGLRERFGFDAFKFRIAAECGRGVDEWPERSQQIITTIGRGMAETGSADGVALLVDANSGFTADQAIAIGRLLEDNGISHFEEPCPYWQPEETRKVTQALGIDVSGGEQDCDLRIWADMLDRHIVDIPQPDVMYMGGLTRCLKVAAMADAAGYPCTPHAANLSLVTICTMHLLRAIPNAGKYLELSIEAEDYYPWQQGLFCGDPFAVSDGMVRIDDTPGWGVEFNPEWLADAEYQLAEWAG